MDDLLPHYEAELGFLRRYSREFAEQYPKIAGRLLMSGEISEDPHVERMIQSFALLNARTSKKIDDDFPEFTEALLEVLYPHYLRPFPSCSIAKFDVGAAGTNSQNISKIPRGTELTTRPVKNVPCKFRTAYDVALLPVKISRISFESLSGVPSSILLPANATSRISIDIQSDADQFDFRTCETENLRLFIDGEPSFCAAFRDALFIRTAKVYREETESRQWFATDGNPIEPVGFSESESLIDFPSRSHPAYRILTEHFAFPEKFNFFDINLRKCLSRSGTPVSSFRLHFVLDGLRVDSNAARLLINLSPKNVLLGCTPIVNLFKQKGDPIRLTHTSTYYPVVADARRAYAYEVYAIDSVKMVRQTPQGESVTEFQPFYSLRHEETSKGRGHYWTKRRSETLATKSPGYETEISIVDIDFDPAGIETQTLSLELRCTNRNLPELLSYGMGGGDLFLEGGNAIRSISFLRKPSRQHAFSKGRGVQWRLISHLALNHRSLIEGGISTLQEILRLYDVQNSAISQRQITSLTSLERNAATAWLPGNPFACLVKGIEITISIDEHGFTGSGVHLFFSVLHHFLGLYVHTNSFVRLVVTSNRTGEEILRCQARNGELNLV